MKSKRRGAEERHTGKRTGKEVKRDTGPTSTHVIRLRRQPGRPAGPGGLVPALCPALCPQARGRPEAAEPRQNSKALLSHPRMAAETTRGRRP